MKRFVDYLRLHWRALIQLHDTPHSIAGGTAIGVFFGFTPLFGFKTLLAIVVAWGFRCSKVAAAVGVTLHDVIIPLMPMLLRMEYGIGYWLLNQHHWPAKMKAADLKIDQWLRWDTLVGVVWPTCLGSLVIGLPLAAVMFFLTLRIVIRFQEKRRVAAAAALNVNLEDIE